jgi:DNA (cytosine-5)-methyltransferase 1
VAQPEAEAVSLCSGVGALDKAVHHLTGARTAVYAENDPWAAKVMARLLPGVENLGGIDHVDWGAVASRYRVSKLIAGWPC